MPAMTRILSLFLVVLCGCGGGLSLNLVEAAYRRPSNVAVYFTVDTNGGDPIGGLQATDFRIYEDGELVSIDESRQTIINPEVAAEHYTLLLIDMSGSVTESDDVPVIVEAATEFTSSLESYQKVGVYAFDGSENIYEMQPFTASEGASTAGVSRLSSFQGRDPSTNLNGAIVKATEELGSAFERSRTPLRFGTIVVFTDGTDRAARVPIGDALDALDTSGFQVFAIGVGNEINESSLADIGYDGYVLASDRSAITAAFQAVSSRIAAATQRFYLLSYCSPARAGTHEVTIEAVTEQFGSGSLTYSFDATGFGPNCNPATPPPFDTSGRVRPQQRIRRERAPGARIDLDLTAEATATVE